MRILLGQINPTIGDLSGNLNKILEGINIGKQASADIVVFPELSICGYPPEDFLYLSDFITACENSLDKIREASKGCTVIVGYPRQCTINPNNLYNSAAIFTNGQLIGIQDKILLPTYDVFSERRYFAPGSPPHLWDLCEKKIAITICEDIWQHSGLLEEASYPFDPILELKKQQPDLLINLSASPYSIAKKDTRLKVCQKAALSLNAPVMLCNQVGGNDGLIFDGYSMHVGKDGQLKHIAKGFEEDFLLVDLDQKSATPRFTDNSISDLYDALVLGVRDYFHKSGFKKACLGISGGIDSAVVAAIACEALSSENVLGLFMPSRFSSPGSITDAIQLTKVLQMAWKEISIEEPFTSYLNLLEPCFEGKPFDATEENLQARIRGMILMAFSNKLGYIVLSTGNKSELALGYSTLYGDMCGGLGVISDVTKQNVYALAKWINRNGEVIPYATINKPPSAELRPNQKDSDTLPKYEVVDNVVQAYVEEHMPPAKIAEKFKYSIELVNELVKKIHKNEYKRRQSPPGLRVSAKAFSVGRRFPIVQRWV